MYGHIHGHNLWPNMAIYYARIYGHIWPHMATYGHMYGHMWPYCMIGFDELSTASRHLIYMHCVNTFLKWLLGSPTWSFAI